MTEYRIAEAISEKAAAELVAYPATQAQLLFNRNIATTQAAVDFITPKYEETLHDPFLLHDMHVAVDRILAAIEAVEKIVIFSDYDCDGIPGAVVLHDFFSAVQYTNFTNYIPHRHYEGFGLSVAAVEKLAAEGAQLIITIDCGISDHEAVARARALGVDVIVTDHHEPKETLPEAVAVVNPKVGDTYPFDGLCGAAVIFKVAQALLTAGDFAVAAGREKWWLDMVGVATIADMVPLVDENRTLAHYGMTVLRKSRRPGLQQLLRKQRANQRFLTEDDIGFTIGPRINASSRMGEPQAAFTLLATTDEAEAAKQVAHLETLNNERKGQVAAMTREAHKRVREMSDMPDVMVLGNPDWRPSLVGLVANKLAEETNRPAFIWGRDGNGVLKGSCRSNGITSLITLMEAGAAAFSEYGGHHFSGGFSIHETEIHTLSAKLNTAFTELGESVVVTEPVTIDALLSVDDVTPQFMQQLAQLAPYGMDNPKPLFQFEAATPMEVQLFGKTKEHTKLLFKTERGQLEAIAFFKVPEQFSVTPTEDTPCTLIAHVEQSFFMGRLQTRLRIVDVM